MGERERERERVEFFFLLIAEEISKRKKKEKEKFTFALETSPSSFVLRAAPERPEGAPARAPGRRAVVRIVEAGELEESFTRMRRGARARLVSVAEEALVLVFALLVELEHGREAVGASRREGGEVLGEE